MFDQIGYIIRLESSDLKVMNGSTIVMKGTRKNGVYVLDGKVIISESSISIYTNINKTKLCHLRLGL